MEQLKKLGGVCRKHYEKLILIFVLLLLAAVVFYLAKASEEETEKLKTMQVELTRRSVKGVPPVDLSRFNDAVKQMTNPPTLNYSGPHNLLNPVKWQQAPGGMITKVKTGKETGVGNLQIVRIRPIYLSVAFGRASTSTQNDQTVVAGYQLYVTNELTLIGNRPRVVPVFTAVGETNKPSIILTDVKGPPEAPTEMVAMLKDYNNERVSFAPGKPYLRPIGYEAELKYPFRNISYSNVRPNQTLDIDGEPYKVVDITQTKVVLFDDSNGKRHNIEQTATP
jgi:hypothetical protein